MSLEHLAPSLTSTQTLCTSSLQQTSVAYCSCRQLAAAEPDASGQATSGDSDSGNGNFAASPKRQYFIAPRIGRSANSQQSAIWTALEEGALSSRGQLQPQRPFPGPLRSSLMYLIANSNNRRLIGPRSGGLLPQARIGRRAAPSGLMPQPRVGRRSPSLLDGEADSAPETDFATGQQEVAVSTLSDSSFADALESLIEG